ncbi:hypothetical protein PF010_g32412 [Phytophthora fragariae]|uniref:Uncharacterized protein n=1 Tax=Phytophthora fragariae TaxID=53985 RepID=A0A6G0JFG4_9STRA|nr:hypothetical protein PF010_g32412 [Phytophthora fragariae]
MVPLGKRAMAPGKIVRSNDVLAHLGDDVFSWRLAMQAVEIIARKKDGARPNRETGLPLNSNSVVKLVAPPAPPPGEEGESAGAGGHDDGCG